MIATCYNEQMERVLKGLDIKGSDIFKFCLTILLPMTIWFMTLKASIDYNSMGVQSNTSKIEYIRDKQDIFNEKVLLKLDVIQGDVSQIKGRLEK